MASIPEEIGDRNGRRDAPHRLGQERGIDNCRLTGALTMEQGGTDAPGQGDPSLQVAEGRALHRGVLGAERRERVGHAAPSQIGGCVEAASIAVGAPNT